MNRQRFTRRTLFAVSVLAAAWAVATTPTVAEAVQCPGTLYTAGHIAGKTSYAGMSPSRPLGNLIGTGCTSSAVGAAQACFANNGSTYGTIRAVWANSAARTGDSTGGCNFMCQNGDCEIRSNGLPVELLQFGVE